MEMKGFRRTLLGYDRDEVDGLLSAEQERLRRLESEAKRLGAKLDDRDRRLKQALDELEAARRAAARKGRARSPIDAGAPAAAPLQPEVGLRRVAEVIYEEAWRQAGRLSERAMRDAARVVGRVMALARLTEVLGGVGLRGDERPPAPQAKGPAAQIEVPDGVFSGEVEVEIGPLRDFAQLSSFEDAANAIGETGQIKVKRFSGGRATLAMDLDQPVELLRELEERASLGFRVRSLKDDRVVLDVDEGDEQAAA